MPRLRSHLSLFAPRVYYPRRPTTSVSGAGTHEASVTARTGAVNAKREGWKVEDFVGRKVKVAGNPTRRNGGTAMAAGVVTFDDGKVVCLGGCPGGPPVE